MNTTNTPNKCENLYKTITKLRWNWRRCWFKKNKKSSFSGSATTVLANQDHLTKRWARSNRAELRIRSTTDWRTSMVSSLRRTKGWTWLSRTSILRFTNSIGSMKVWTKSFWGNSSRRSTKVWDWRTSILTFSCNTVECFPYNFALLIHLHLLYCSSSVVYNPIKPQDMLNWNK